MRVLQGVALTSALTAILVAAPDLLHAQMRAVMHVLSAGKNEAALPPRVHHGESFHFNVGYLGMTGARAAVSVEKEGDAGTLITADVENTFLLRFIFRIRDRFQSSLDERGITVSTKLWQNENGAHRYREESFFDDRVVTTERAQSGEKVRNIPVPTKPMDPLASLFWLRGQKLVDGDVLTAPLFANNRVFDSRIRVLGRERIIALGRNWAAIRLHAEFMRDGQVVQGVQGSFWVSDDGERIPLKAVAETTYGRVNFVLERVER